MIKKIFLISLFCLSKNVYSQCIEQDKFTIKWNINGTTISYDIKKKDGSDFYFYKNKKSFTQIYNGIKIDTRLKIPQENFAIFRVNQVYKENFNTMENLLMGDNNNYLSLYINSNFSSKTYEFPLELNKFLMTKKIQESFKIEDILSLYNDILISNDIFGNHKIRYYLILFHDTKAIKCSYFESPEIEYDLGRKPLSLVWKDFWNK